MRTRLCIAILGAGLLLTAAPVWAHHAFAAEFDSTKPIKLRGTVTKEPSRNNISNIECFGLHSV